VLTIGSFARLSGVSAKMLRAYDALGLFRPVWVDRPTRYRYYSPAQLPQLRRILALRDLGMGLAEIAGLIHGRSDLGVALERRRSELELARAEIERQLATLEIGVDVAGGAAAGLDVVVLRAPAVLVAVLPIALVTGGDAEAAFYELEAYVRDTHRRAHGPPGMLVGGSPDARTREVFVPLTRPIPATERIGVRRLAAAQMASVLHRGDYGGMNATRAALEYWIERTGRRSGGPLRVLYLQFGAEPELALPRGYVVQDAADFVTELQLPIEPDVA
jgi:DNA-binding transcriptional MerR regulator